MKKYLIGAVSAVTVLSLSTGSAFAWEYDLTGSGKCQPDGSFLITWVVDNSKENETLTVRKSSNPSVVPVGSEVSAHAEKSYNQSVAGDKTGDYTLELKANWPSDTALQTMSDTVTLGEPCDQPAPVSSTGGRGGVQETTPTAVAAAAPAPQVEQVPVGAVDAGEGSQTFSQAALLGLTGSMAAAIAGVRRFLKSEV